jgi:ankyrin repeat protein
LGIIKRRSSSETHHDLLRINTGLRSPLQWALQENQYEIARLLVNHGACLAHVSVLGWTPASYLWPSWETRPDSAIKYLQLFGNDGSIELEVFDKWGWTVLHRAAAFGKADEVEALIRLGACPTTCALPLHWMAIHHAVYYGNFETFLVLINPKNGASLASPDARGWTLLHIAASAGHDDITRHLLSLGADRERLTLPYMSYMPEQLFNQVFTPAKAAAAQSEERYCRYMEALVSFGLKDPQEDQSSDWASDDDEFVDALDALPILQ